MQPSTRPAPHIPAELLEKIFWHARHHHSTLASCARVCHFWLPTSRRLLYSRVRVGSFSQRSQSSQRSLLGGLPQLADILDSAPPIRDYIQRVEVAWTTSIDCQALASTLALLPKVLTLSFWNTGRPYGAPDRQFLAFSGIQHPSPRRDPPRKPVCEKAWLSLHAEVATLTPTLNTVQPLLDVFDIFHTVDWLYFMSGTKVLIDQDLRRTLRFSTSCRDIHTLDVAFDGVGLFTWQPVRLLQDLVAHSRPRRVGCTRWRCPGNARSLGMILQDVGADVEHLHLYLRWFMRDVWSALNLQSCPRLHTIHFIDFWTWFEYSDAQWLFAAIRRDAPQVRALVFESTTRDLPDKSYDAQPQIQWLLIDETLSSMTQLERVVVQLDAFRPTFRKEMKNLMRVRLPESFRRGMICFELENEESENIALATMPIAKFARLSL